MDQDYEDIKNTALAWTKMEQEVLQEMIAGGDSTRVQIPEPPKPTPKKQK